jgi:iron complex transport system ATP-binding protein
MFAAYDLTVRVNRSTLLSGVSVAAIPGQITAVVGPNGAGKSTLVRAMAGDLTVTAGEIVMGGRPLARWRAADAARTRAVLLQHAPMGFAFTAFEVALLGRAPHAATVGRARNLAIARAALAAADVAHLRERLYPTLSGGERQRVQLARALAQIWDVAPDAPRYLLLDEPTAALDLAHQHRMLQCLRAWAARGAGVLLVLHDLNLAAEYADRVLVLQNGRTRACGPPADALVPTTIEEVFGVRVTLVDLPDRSRPFLVPQAVPAPRPRGRVGAA